jgi:protein TonB
MLAIALGAHALLFAGLRFGGAWSDAALPAGLEVRLVSDELPESRRNDTATYLSQRTQLGSGNTQEREAARIPGGASAGEPPRPEHQAGETRSGDDVERLATTHPRARIAFVAPHESATTETSATPPLPLMLGNGDSAARPPGPDTDEDLALRGPARDELTLSPDTRASELAPYLDSWRRRVEKVGTLNYPTAAARRRLKGNPVIEVTLRQDGALKSARILRSSGYSEIDAAALQILRLASPYDPFPPTLAARYRTLHFAYEWQFVGGRMGSRVSSVP